MKITRWPALILANYRTSSSALCYGIALENSIKSFVEPTITQERSQEFLEYYKINDQYIVKFMPDQVNQFVPYQELLASDCYKIKLTRNNKALQIASHYIASVRNKWWTTSKEEQTNYFIPIITEQINQSIERIQLVDSMLDSYSGFDIEVTSEDIGIIDEIDRAHSRKPSNFEHLINIIKERL